MSRLRAVMGQFASGVVVVTATGRTARSSPYLAGGGAQPWPCVDPLA